MLRRVLLISLFTTLAYLIPNSLWIYHFAFGKPKPWIGYGDYEVSAALCHDNKAVLTKKGERKEAEQTFWLLPERCLKGCSPQATHLIYWDEGCSWVIPEK